MPQEGVLEEIYHFLFQPEQGFAIQCAYTKDGEFDEAYRVQQDDLVEFPRGYHTTVGAPGYNTYFLWQVSTRASSAPTTPTMTGSRRLKTSSKRADL